MSAMNGHAPDEIVTEQNLSKDLLRATFAEAYMDVSLDDDGDIQIKEQYRSWLLLDKENRWIRIYTPFKANPEIQRGRQARLCEPRQRRLRHRPRLHRRDRWFRVRAVPAGRGRDHQEGDRHGRAPVPPDGGICGSGRREERPRLTPHTTCPGGRLRHGFPPAVLSDLGDLHRGSNHRNRRQQFRRRVGDGIPVVQRVVRSPTTSHGNP